LSLNNIAIIGLGLIGGSFAKALKHANPTIHISAFDREEVLNLALTEKVIDEKLTFSDQILNSDIIFLALPIESSLEIFKNISPQLNENQIISDLCSVKGIFIDTWKTLSSKGTYIGAHPMTGKEKSGYENSDALLFENSVFIVCTENGKSKLFDEYINLVKSSGARISLLDAKLHDKITSEVSHLPQLLSVLLINHSSQKKDEHSFLDFAAGGFRDMTRIAASDFGIWESIIKYNKTEILDSIGKFEKQLSSIKDIIKKDDYSDLNKMFDDARQLRNEIPINTKGFIDPLYDITVFVKDQPGMISKISTILFENNINIKDIELLKIREGTGGNFKFYFDSESDAEKAKVLIEKIGFSTQ
jgi:prephenate dehydrogenase